MVMWRDSSLWTFLLCPRAGEKQVALKVAAVMRLGGGAR